MRQLNLNLPETDKPLYLRIADAIREAVRKGQILPGENLISSRELARSLNVHRHTVMNALNELVAEGWLIANQRRGYQVCDTLPTTFFESSEQSNPEHKISEFEWKFARQSSLQESFDPKENYRYYFKAGLPDFRLFPFHELKSNLMDSIKDSSSELLEYGSPQGHGSLIEALQTYLRRMRGLTGKDIVITHGSQEAIYIAGQLLIPPGGFAAVEKLGYPPAWAALRAAGANLVGIEHDDVGLDPNSLEDLAKKHDLKLIYLSPLHQYPTTRTLPIPRRLQIYEIAARYGIPILEDDYDHEFHYRCQPLAPLATTDPAGLVLYVSTFSKVLFPSARIGFMAIPPGLTSELVRFRRIIDYQNETLLQDSVARWIHSGGLERHLRRMRNIYEKRRNIMIQCLQEANDSGCPLDIRIPDGGMAVWFNAFKDSQHVCEKAKQAGIFLQGEHSFQLQATQGTHLRLGFASQTEEEIKEGMSLLMEVIQSI